jgi:putative oxidoreductase
MSGATDTAKLVGRLALALIFVLSGANKIGTFAQFTAGLEAGGVPAPQVLGLLGVAVELGAGLALVIGLQTRLAALGLVVFTIAATLIAHRFWEIADPQAQQMQMIMFLKNVAIIGGLFYVAAAGAGRFSLDRGR